MRVRQPNTEETDALARIWYDSWLDAHAEIFPAALARTRTVESLTERLGEVWADIRVVGETGRPQGFSITQGAELNQLYVASDSRGHGVAQALIAEVEERLADRGISTAWLACAVGNARAARFYEKSGWHLAKTFVTELSLPDGQFQIDVWRYEKELRRADK